MRFINTWTKTAAFALAVLGVDAKEEASARVEAGMLTCEVGKGFALIFSKPRDLHCVFHKSNGQNEAYAGKLREFGLDVGVSGRGVIAWEVIASTTALAPGELAGTYAGVEAGAAAVIGGRGRVLIGGADKTVSLQPLSVQGETGINLALGVASMSLHPVMTGRPRAGTHAPAVGHSHAAIPHAQQIPHYGCGSYTHLQRGQTLYGLAHACGVTLEALLDANPQISNVRDIDAGALVHLPTHVGHHASSPCGDRAVLHENESLDHLAWRCGVTLHALLLENPDVRDMAMVEPGLVLAIPEKGAPATEPPVQYAMTEADILPSGRFVASDAAPVSGPLPGLSNTASQIAGLSARDQARLEIICVNEATNRYGLQSGDVFATNSVSASGQTISITLDANGDDGVCLIDRGGNVLFVTDLSSSSRRGNVAAAVAGAVVGGSLATIAANNRSSDGAAAPSRSAPTRGNYVPEEDIFVVSLANPGSYLNAHNAPSASAPVVGRFANGTTLGNVGGCQYPGGRQWCEVRPSGGGIRGWVAGEFLTVPGAGGSVAAARAPSSVARPSSTQSGSGDRTETVRFQPGASSATMRGSTQGYNSVNYLLGANPGQTMSVQFRPDNASCYFNVIPPSGGSAIFIGSTSGNEFSGTLREAGNYTVQTYLMRNAARRNETCRYSIAFEITGGGAQASRSGERVTTDVAAQVCAGHASQQFGMPMSGLRVLSSIGSSEGTGVELSAQDGRQGRCFISPTGDLINFEVTSTASVAPSSSDVSGAAQQACLSAVSNQTNERNVSVMSTEFSQANSLVMVGVGANRAPWRCLVSNDGVVQEVMFTGDDSAGVDQSAAPAENTATADDGGGAMAGSEAATADDGGGAMAGSTAASDVSDAAVQACRSTIDDQTDGEVVVLSTEFSEANSLVMIGVGSDRAPWRCLVSNDGAVQEVSFAGSEGAL